MPKQDVLKMLGTNTNLCLFCCYADENATDYNQRNKQKLKQIFKNVVDLTPNFKFDKQIDCVFMNGGNVFELIYKLKKYKQFDKIKNLIENGTVYIGNSAGSEVCMQDCYFISEFEPPQIKMDVKENSQGFGFVDKKILVEASRYTLSRKHGLVKESNYHNYLVYKLKQKNGIKVANNGVVIINDENIKTKKYPWIQLLELNKI